MIYKIVPNQKNVCCQSFETAPIPATLGVLVRRILERESRGTPVYVIISLLSSSPGAFSFIL
jgi:hypothetical protein